MRYTCSDSAFLKTTHLIPIPAFSPYILRFSTRIQRAFALTLFLPFFLRLSRFLAATHNTIRNTLLPLLLFQLLNTPLPVALPALLDALMCRHPSHLFHGIFDIVRLLDLVPADAVLGHFARVVARHLSEHLLAAVRTLDLLAGPHAGSGRIGNRDWGLRCVFGATM